MMIHNQRRAGAVARVLAGVLWATLLVVSMAGPAWAGHAPTQGPPPPPQPGNPPPPQNCDPSVTCCQTASGGKPVDLWNGREFLTHTDLELPGLVPIVIRRSYDSQAQFDSALGYGWALSYFMRLYEYTDGSVILRRDCGMRRPFLYAGGAYQTPVGESGTLVKEPDGTWTYTEKSGEVKRFDAEGRLSAIVSRQGPYLEFTYDSRGKLPLIGLSPYAIDPTPKEIAREHRLLRIDEYTASGAATGRYVTFTYNDQTGRLTSVSDSAGRTVGYQHDGIGNLTEVDLPENAVLGYEYEDPLDSHNATTLTDSACTSCSGGTYVNTYDSQDRVIRQEHGTGVLRFTYEEPYVKTTVDEEVRDDQGTLLFTATTKYEFNGLGNPTKITDALGHQTVRDYDGLMNLRREERWENVSGTLVLRSVEERTYDARSNLLTLTEAKDTPQQRVTTYTYDEADRVLTITVPSVVNPAQNKVATFTYDDHGNVLTRTEAGLLGDGNPYQYVTIYTYDGNGRLATVDGPRTDVSDVTTFAHDTIGTLQSVTRPGSLTTTYTNYTAASRPQTITDPNGVATTLTYDAVGRVKTTTIAGTTTTYGYTTTGKIASVTLPRANATNYTYDGLNRLTTIRDALGNTVNYTYDSAGGVLREEIKDPQGALQKTVSYTYNVLKRIARIVNPDSTYTELTYNYAGNRKTVTNPRGYMTSYEYDPLRRLVDVTQPGSALTHYTYNRNDNVTSVTDAEQHATTYTYDDMGRVYQEISPDAGTTTYDYDAAGNVTSKTDARGIRVRQTFDGNNRLTLVDFPTDPDIIYTYDYNYNGSCTNGRGRLCQVQDQSGTTSYAYTAKGELLQDRKVILGVPYVTRYDPDANGNVEVITYPSGRTVVYTYDTADRPISLTTTPFGGTPQTVATNVAYKPFGGVRSLVYGNGLNRTIAYDTQYYIGSIQTTGVQDLGYGDDANGNITSITDALDPSRNKTFGYDELDRLTSASGPWGSLGWTYDKVGNRLTQTGPEGDSLYSYLDGTNRLDKVSGPETIDFGYDENGNVRAENDRSYTFNQNNRLVVASEITTLGEYTLNAKEQRAVKVADGQTTVFHYDRAGHILAESQASGLPTAESIYLNGQPIAQAVGPALSFIHTDHLGTPQVMTDVTGATVWRIEARPFGDAPTITGTATLNLRFPGQYYDAETGLHQNWWRDYKPQLGRYMSIDPLYGGARSVHYGNYNPPSTRMSRGYRPAEVDDSDVSSYVYVANGPTMHTDPFGLFTLPADPSKLPPGWIRDSQHRNPNGERFNGPNGDTLEFHKGQEGKRGWRGKDHWHHNDGDEHLPPGSEIPDPPPSEDPDPTGQSELSDFCHKYPGLCDPSRTCRENPATCILIIGGMLIVLPCLAL